MNNIFLIKLSLKDMYTNNFYDLRSRKVNLNKKYIDIVKDNKNTTIQDDKNNINISNEEKCFIDKTISPDQFVIEDVLGDNSCFYRCISNIIYYYSGIISTKKIDLKNTKQADSFGYSSNDQELMSRKLQRKIARWLFKNKDKNIKEIGLPVKEFVVFTHDLLEDYICDGYKGENIYDVLMEEYLRRYYKFAGDTYNDEYDRWGGAPEQYAISEILKVPVYVYVYKKYNKRLNKIENGRIRNNKPEKGVRLQLYQQFGKQYSNKNGIHILYKNNTKCEGHYMCLYKI